MDKKIKIRIRDPDSDSGSGINIPDHIFKSLETIFWSIKLKVFDADAGSGSPERHALLIMRNILFSYLGK